MKNAEPYLYRRGTLIVAHLIEFLRSHDVALSTLAKFAKAMVIIVCVPRLSRPAVLGLLFSGIVIGHHGLDVIGTTGRSQISWRTWESSPSVLRPVLT